MPIFHMNEPRHFVPIAPTRLTEERTLEDWVEDNPHLLFEGERVAIIAREPSTPFGKYPDLIGIDETGACVVIELKRGQTPRDVLAQTLEYAAWVDSLTVDQLDELARKYGNARGVDIGSIADLYHHEFERDAEAEDAEPQSTASKITFNNRQRLIIVAEHISPELEQTLRYLRTKLGLDITGLVFSVHQAGSETMLMTDVIVGREPLSSAVEKAPIVRGYASLGSLLSGKSDFVKSAITELESRIQSLEIPTLRIASSPGLNSFYIEHHGRNEANYWAAKEWIGGALYRPTPDEEATLRARLSKPADVKLMDYGIGFRIRNNADLDVLLEIVASRVGVPR
jgi:hypothetical protein